MRNPTMLRRPRRLQPRSPSGFVGTDSNGPWTLPKPSLTARVNPRLTRAFEPPVRSNPSPTSSSPYAPPLGPPLRSLNIRPAAFRLSRRHPPPAGHPPRPSANPCRRLRPSIPPPWGCPAAAPPPAPCFAGADSHGPMDPPKRNPAVTAALR
jgi:hypothetical protein